MVARREELERELERMGVERARLLADNIELDQRAGQLAERDRLGRAWVENLAAAETAGRASLAALDESLKALRADAQASQERRSRDRSGAGPQARRICAISTRPAARS